MSHDLKLHVDFSAGYPDPLHTSCSFQTACSSNIVAVLLDANALSFAGEEAGGLDYAGEEDDRQPETITMSC